MTGTVATQMKAIDFTSDIAKLTENFTGRQWVFDDIDRWLRESDERFFILTGKLGVGKSAIAAHLIQTLTDIVAHHLCHLEDEETVRPGRVLRSLAAQLTETIPYYGDALINTIKPARLSADVHINTEEAIQSNVQRVKIDNVNTSDIANELDILIRAPLAALPEIYEEKGKELPKVAIILIDGLDVAVTMEPGVQENSEDESLPSWVRFLFTTRPDRRVLREFEPLKPHLLEEMSAENLTDVRQYVNHRMASSPAIQQQVAATQIDIQGWVEQLTERSQGNFRYIKSLLDDLEAGRCSLDALPILPHGLAESYARDFAQRFPKGIRNRSGDRVNLLTLTILLSDLFPTDTAERYGIALYSSQQAESRSEGA